MKNQIQSQLSRLLLVLFIITGLNAAFLWHTLDQLFDSYSGASKSERLTSLVGDLELLIYQEKMTRSDSNLDDAARVVRLEDFKQNISNNFKQIMEIVAADKKKNKKIKDIQNEWQTSKSSHDHTQLLILLNSFIKEEFKSLISIQNDANVPKYAKASVGFILIYIGIFSLALIFLGQYLKRKVFYPLARLSTDMKNFQAGNHELGIRSFSNDEIGYLESKFIEMAERIESTVDELKALDKIKTDFLSLASHELRTPMTSVKGSLSLILSGNLSEVHSDIKELLLISEKETDRLIRLINDILDLTKIEAHKATFDKKWYNLPEIINTVIASLHGLYSVTGVKVEMNPDNPPCEVEVDKDRLQQVITNLLSNAVKFSPKGSTVEISYEIKSDESEVTVFVKDRGPGIKEEDQMLMFEKFRSRDMGASKIIKGTGLGLPICKALIEEHGGRIGVRSEVGAGSTFFFTLPQVRTNESAAYPTGVAA